MSLYLDLLARVLCGMIHGDAPYQVPWLEHEDYQEGTRRAGTDWPTRAHTMIGPVRLGNVRDCVEQALADGIPGDLLEAGAWRGGACIMMRAVLKARGVTDRLVWVADSFQGLPPGSGWPREEVLAVPLPAVRRNFDVYGLLDDQVRFIPGWFRDSLPGPVGSLAVLRLDGDLYESQRDVLSALESRVSTGGFVIVDDYHLPGCRQAVDEYRALNDITAPLQPVVPEEHSVFWRKE